MEKVKTLVDNKIKYGFQDENGKWIIKPIYDDIFRFFLLDDYYTVKVNGNWGVINNFEEWVLMPEYEDINLTLNENSVPKFIVKINNQVGIINDKSEWILHPHLEDIQPETFYSKSGYYIIKEDGKFGILDTTGKYIDMIIYPQYDFIKYLCIFNDGMPLFSDASRVYIVKSENKFGLFFLDEENPVLTKTVYDEIIEIREEVLGSVVFFFKAKLNNIWGGINREGKFLVDIEFEKYKKEIINHRFEILSRKQDELFNSFELEFPNIFNRRKENNLFKELDKLIGLTEVKQEVRDIYSYVNNQKIRKENGLKTKPISYHMVFYGPPGTGKTTVARIVAKMFKELGILKKGHFIEADRSQLVGEYLGHTAIKVNQILDRALDGILFIDEAYSLFSKQEDIFAKEAVSTLIKSKK